MSKNIPSEINQFLGRVIMGDCIEVLKTLPDNSVDSIVTDPPAGIEFMGKEWDSFKDGKIEPTSNSAGGTEDKEGIGNAFSRSRVHIGASSKKSLFVFQDFIYQVFSEAIRVLKPGGHILVWAIPRTSHHTAMGIERAGFEIRDKIYFVFGSGFPKSLNIGKAVDKLQGNKREVIRKEKEPLRQGGSVNWDMRSSSSRELTKGNSPYEGQRTALKPAVEEWILARKPISEKTIAKNVLKWGTGGLNIDGCRIETNDMLGRKNNVKPYGNNRTWSVSNTPPQDNTKNPPRGRFPSHLILDGSEEVEECLPKNVKGWSSQKHNSFNPYGGNALNKSKTQREGFYEGYDDSGSASRFFQHCPITEEDIEYDRIFYGSKASRKERNMGLDKLVIISIMKIWKENNIIKEEELAQLLMDTDILRKRDIEEFGIQNKKGLEWNTVLFGKDLMEKYQRDVVSIIGTEINSITPLKIWNWLNFLLTKEYTLDVKYEMENGGNPVANAENYKPLIITINEKMASRLGVKNVVEGTQLKISVKDGSNIHPTCKSLSLMRYLCRLITPPKGIVLDMFAGSGSTLIAAKQEGFNFIGIEQEKDYIEIAEARLKATPTPML